MRIFFVSTFVGTFLPASVGGDAVRAFSMTQLNVRGRDAIASVFLDRMLGVASILLMAALGLVLAQDLAANRTIVAALVLATAVCAATLLLIFSPRAAAAALAHPGVASSGSSSDRRRHPRLRPEIRGPIEVSWSTCWRGRSQSRCCGSCRRTSWVRDWGSRCRRRCILRSCR
jgi:hypothetical protein